MNLFPLPKTASLSVLFGLSFASFAWSALSLTLASLFLFPLILFCFLFFGLFTLFIGYRLYRLAPRDLCVTFVITLLYASTIGYISEPTLFSGRDQGSIAEAAYRLADQGELAFTTGASQSFFNIYGPGTALNFPGFAYTNEGYLMTQFPLGYTAWLASFVSLFGLAGYAIANSILLFLFLFFFYQLIRLFTHPFYAFSGIAIAMTSFLPSFFAKMTLTENFALFLFTFLCYNVILFLREGKFLYYTGILLTGSLFAFTRIEGFAFFFLALALIAFHKHTRHLFRTYPWKSIALPLLLFAFVFLRDLFLNLPYYKMIGKALFKFTRGLSGEVVSGPISNGSAMGLGSVFLFSGLLFIVLLGLFGIILFFKKRAWFLLVPAALALPTFLYLFDPNITPDYPWMLRRFLFSLFPLFVFSLVLAVALLFSERETLPLSPDKYGQKKSLFFAGALFLALIIFQYPAFQSGFFFASARGLDEQVEVLTREFSDQDLILVDRGVTGDGFSMLTGPGQFLYGKNTVYFFNPDDLARLDMTPFERVYLLTPEENQSLYTNVFGERLVFKKNVTLRLTELENISLRETRSLRLPQSVTKETTSLLFQIY